MSRRRKLHEASTKARVALEAVKERETVTQISKRFGVHPTQVNQWKRKLLEEAAELFERENGRAPSEAFGTKQADYPRDQAISQEGEACLGVGSCTRRAPRPAWPWKR